MTTIDNPFAEKTGIPTLSFSSRDQYDQLVSKPFGTRLGGTISKSPEKVQQTGYKGTQFAGKKLFWDGNSSKGAKTDQPSTPTGQANNPVVSIVLSFSDAVLSDGTVGAGALWCPRYPADMYEAIQEALGDRAIEAGDKLFVTLTGKRPIEGKNPAYTYTAEFTKGAGVFAAEAPKAAPAGPPAPAGPAGPPAPAPAPAAPAPAPVLVDGYDKAAYIASGWTEDAMKAEAKFAPFFPAPAAPAPAGPAGPAGPAAPPVDIEAQRAAAMAKLSPEDRALLYGAQA